MSQSLYAADTTAELALAGDLTRPARLTVPDLLAWPQHEADVSFECATSGIQHHRFTGPLLHDVLSAAGPVFDPARRKDRLRFLIAVSGADGHHALLSWAEIDPDFGRAPVLLAATIDGTPLDRAAPSSSCPRTAAAPGTSAASPRSAWTAATPRGRDTGLLRTVTAARRTRPKPAARTPPGTGIPFAGGDPDGYGRPHGG